MNEMEVWASLMETQRHVAWVNEHGWKFENRPRRSLRVPLAKALVVLAQRIAPAYPKMERRTDALAQP
ncbi:MAG: hypothetical protein ACYDAR_13705 [Thermomicrobiales bacterium]